jgi:hypothetical protein
MRALSDTSPAAERVMIEGLRRMTAEQKLARVMALNQVISELASARLRTQYPGITSKELQLRLAALRLDAGTMRDVFDWDPSLHGL